MNASALRKHITQLAKRLRQEGRNSPETWTQMLVLSSIDHHGSSATPSVIAKAESMQSSNLAATLRDLEAAGLIHRQADQQDRRKILLSLSEQGQALLKASRDRRDTWLGEAMKSQLTDSEREQLENIIPILVKLARAP
ncbi:MarR family winged helix-turn-helix transcriptional regulator [Pseudomonas fuscovaginae]|uniref:Transcriptional regulator n=1 Tax=Pseudomonas asplenii TaxID=53407 RepID=A0A0M9GII6_9PSED|nr:MarR family transcriptional regulator [Pseudomonas fuscovaginae]KPA91765.1 transcriptional regulator [Pseudomonas fuscovaginae]